MQKVLCTALNTDVGPHLQMLRDAGFEVLHAPQGVNLYQSPNLLECARGVSGVIAGSEPWPASLLEQLPDLRVLSRTGVGYDAIDLPTCDRLKIVVATTPGVNHHAVAEHTMAMIFGIGRHFPARDQELRAGKWLRVETPRIMGRTLALIGVGRIGRAVATRARGVGMNVVAYDPFPPEEFADQWQIKLVSLEEALRQGDYVSLHLPAGPATRHLINKKTLALMKPGAVLVNTARGALVNEPDLIDALNSGHLRGAGLDVFEVEPLPSNSPFLTMSNVLLSGHIAGLDQESQFDTLTMAANTIISLSRGKWPTPCIRNLVGVTDWKWS